MDRAKRAMVAYVKTVCFMILFIAVLVCLSVIALWTPYYQLGVYGIICSIVVLVILVVYLIRQEDKLIALLEEDKKVKPAERVNWMSDE